MKIVYACEHGRKAIRGDQKSDGSNVPNAYVNDDGQFKLSRSNDDANSNEGLRFAVRLKVMEKRGASPQPGGRFHSAD